MLDDNFMLRDTIPMRQISAAHVRATMDTIDTLSGAARDSWTFGEALEQTRHIGIKAVRTSSGRYQVTAEELAQRSGIGIENAMLTTQYTTQRGVRTQLNPTMSRRYPTNDRMLRYRRLPCDMFTDTKVASVTSWRRQNKYAQAFGTRNNWARMYPIRTCLLYTSPSPRDLSTSRMPSSA